MQLEIKHFAAFTIATFQGRIARKPKRHSRFHVQDLPAEHHLAPPSQGEVDVMEVIAFLLSTGAPFPANLSIEDAYQVDAQPFQ